MTCSQTSECISAKVNCPSTSCNISVLYIGSVVVNVCSNNSYILYYCNLYNLCVIFKFALAPSIAVSFCVDTLQDIPTYSGLLVLTTIAIDAVALPIM